MPEEQWLPDERVTHEQESGSEIDCDSSAGDADLLAAIARGREDCFGELVRRYKDTVFSLALRLSANPEDAADIAQEAFIRAFQALMPDESGRSYREEGHFKAWLLRITRNSYLDLCRTRKREGRPQSWSSVEAFYRDQHRESAASPWGQLADNEVRRQLDRALPGLPEQQREVFIYFYLHGMSVVETAGITGQKEGTVRVNLYRARKALGENPAMQKLQEALQ